MAGLVVPEAPLETYLVRILESFDGIKEAIWKLNKTGERLFQDCFNDWFWVIIVLMVIMVFGIILKLI